MTARDTLLMLADGLRAELATGILPYWTGPAVDDGRDGFVGLVDARGRRHPDAPKGAVLNTRILWTFSAARRFLDDPAFEAPANRAAEFVRCRLIDPEHGGVYWMVGPAGGPVDDRKHVYAQAFAIYALAEHALATDDDRSLDRAIALFELLETNAVDDVEGGYHEAFSRDWRPLEDVRLSDQDARERKSMNTHLHVMEAYAALHRAWPDPGLGQRIRELVSLFVDRIADLPAGHLRPFFDADWTPRSNTISYGHDIEASWLLLEAVDTIGDDGLRSRVRPVSLALARSTLREALGSRGGIAYEAFPEEGRVDTDREWWPQAEAIVGFLSAYRETDDGEYLDAGWRTWTFVRDHVVDRDGGEWYRRVAPDGTPRPGHEKVGPWKGPYHGARACMVGAERAKALAARSAAPVPGSPPGADGGLPGEPAGGDR